MFLTAATPAGRKSRQRGIARNAGEIPPDALARALALFDRAETEHTHYLAGLYWYNVAHDTGQSLAGEHNVTTATALGIIAALSPQTGWARNVALADEYLRTGTAPHYDDALAKCAAITAGADPADVLGGRKVRSFYPNMLRPETPGPVTVDRHMGSILLGHSLTRTDRTLERAGNYQRAAATLRAGARLTGLLPHRFQAILWCQYRAETGADRFDNPNGALTPAAGDLTPF